MNRLFVYGTLRPNEENAHILEAIGGTFKKGFIYGTHYTSGFGPGKEYPGVVLSGTGKIPGYIFYSDQLANSWTALDEFEGEGYYRVSVEVQLEDGTTTTAYIYTTDAP
ncbi:gamma-glutamylcyclotransferase family protein [Chitinophaga silvisoli]|uniref:Gamma-glutamylcyclotransferase n=1 Tax=Chitinophaga silvisoli TaxID=2291814 RepID=A0A3E1P9Y7_9BACT|nr:gamma-glutamylcyclotransferase [Chitinophaga silvisoli]RFM36993.1 gamma-glutamylcyclotransferase [Chitinophaga silvisoli]